MEFRVYDKLRASFGVKALLKRPEPSGARECSQRRKEFASSGLTALHPEPLVARSTLFHSWPLLVLVNTCIMKTRSFRLLTVHGIFLTIL